MSGIENTLADIYILLYYTNIYIYSLLDLLFIVIILFNDSGNYYQYYLNLALLILRSIFNKNFNLFLILLDLFVQDFRDVNHCHMVISPNLFFCVHFMTQSVFANYNF